MKNYYDILNATPTSTLEELKANYKQLILQYHPDKRQNQETSAKQEGSTASNVTENNKYLDIAEAWNCLKDTKKRKQYDAELMLNKFQMHQNIYTRISLDDMTKFQEKDDKEIESNCRTTTATTKPQYIYVYNCGCGGQYIVDGIDDESSKKLHRKHHNDTRIPQQKHNNKNSSKNNAEDDRDNKVNGINMNNDDHSDDDDEEEEDFELVVECDECSLAIIIN